MNREYASGVSTNSGGSLQVSCVGCMQCQGVETSQSKELFGKRAEGQVVSALKQTRNISMQTEEAFQGRAIRINKLKNIVCLRKVVKFMARR